MNSKELRDKAEQLSGLPPHKNKNGIGAYRWLADKLEVHPSTVARWIRGRENGNTGSNIPEWAVERIEKIEREMIVHSRIAERKHG